MKRGPKPARWAAAALAAAAVVGWKIADDRYPWLWAYLADSVRVSTRSAQTEAVEGPTHILFCFVDHFEPHDQEAMDRWMRGYPALAGRHRDADGRPPQHTWFWYFAESDEGESVKFLQQLAQLTYGGYGEVELHLHHWGDTAESLRRNIARRLELSRQTGAMVTTGPEPKGAFGFIHGMWGLDNSRPGFCGVNSELILLRELGCYADFTHPSWGRMHPRTVNRLYYAADDPQRPKSYDSGPEMRVGGAASGDLLIFEGPSVVRWRGLRPAYDHGDVTMEDLPTPERIDSWIRAGVHVQGRPEWVFVKVFTHGAVARDGEAVLGEWADRMYSTLERKYNDGTRYALHYVTAREAVNIAKAAEAGKSGNPNDHRDFSVPPYANRFMTASVPYELLRMDGRKTLVRFLAEPGSSITVQLRAPEVVISSGRLKDLSIESEPSRNQSRISFLLTGSDPVEFTTA